MNQNTIEDLKSELEEFRNNLEEVHTDANQQITIKINGHFKIMHLNIASQLEQAAIEKAVPELFSKAMESIGQKIRKKLENLQAVPR
ncbi:hypothetical protein [Aquirufa sp.]|jgi:hypothetical protein|uniref:hypothetical protein n=1 Tax=Aquirufa sp. TaxID=2676249 RepID=UPI0037C0725A